MPGGYSTGAVARRRRPEGNEHGFHHPRGVLGLHALGLGVHARNAVGIDDDAQVYLTISLGEPYNMNDDCYKLAAAVIAVE